MKKPARVLILARTAVLIALLIAFQFATKALGQLVTGTCVNLILAVSVLTCGICSGAAVAVISPLFAFLFGIGPSMIHFVPAIALGNVIYIILIGFLSSVFVFKGGKIAAVVIAASAKFIVLFLLVTRFIIPILSISGPSTAILAAGFSWPQLITALVGGILAIFVAKAISIKAKC